MKKNYLLLFGMLLLTTGLSWSQKTTIIRFDGSQITETYGINQNRFFIDEVNAPYVANLAFSETTSLFQKLDPSSPSWAPVYNGEAPTGVFDMKGGVVIDHSYMANPVPTTPAVLPRDFQVPLLNSTTSVWGKPWSIQALTMVPTTTYDNAAGTGAYKVTTLIGMWTKDQFANGAKGTNVIFDANSKIEAFVPGFDGAQNPVFRFFVKNGTQYYLSEKNFWNGQLWGGSDATYTLTDFNNNSAADKKWYPYDPATLAYVPSGTAVAVNFDNVQAVGIVIHFETQYERGWGMKTFTVEATKFNPTPADPNLLAYDDLQITIPADSTYMFLRDAASPTSFGWSGAWGVEGANVNASTGARNQFQIRNTIPVTYENVASTPNYAVGGFAYQGGGRVLNRDQTGSPFDYCLMKGAVGYQAPADPRANAIGKEGTTLWFSALYRRDKANADNVIIFHRSDIVATSGVSGNKILGATVVIENNKFGLKTRTDNTTFTDYPRDNEADGLVTVATESSDVEAIVGKTYLIVVKFEFGETGNDSKKHKVSLFVNPTGLTEPTEAVATVLTPAKVPFKNIGWKPDAGGGNNGASIDEIRFGKTYASVVPEAPKPTFSISAGATGVDVATSSITATFPTALFKPGTDYTPIDQADIDQMLTLTQGSNNVPFTASVSGNVITVNITNPLGYYTDYKLKVLGGKATDAFSFYTAADSVTFRTVPDNRKLQARIDEANTLISGAEEGSETGKYDPNTKPALQSAIDAAQGVLDVYATKAPEDLESATYALDKSLQSFKIGEVGYSGEYYLFREGFKYNTWHQGRANTSNEFENYGKGYYIDEPIYICGNWGGEKGWQHTSGGSNLNLGAGMAEFNIRNLNTSLVQNAKLSLAQCWDPIKVSYSSDQGVNWTELVTKTSLWSAGNWFYYEYTDALPSASNLWIKIEKVNPAGGTTLIDDVVVKGTGHAPQVTFNIEDNAAGLPPNQQMIATSNTPLVKVPNLDQITDADALTFFELKEGSSTGADVSFSATIDAEKKVLTVTPGSSLNTGAVYYFSFIDRKTANMAGVRTSPVRSITFITKANISVLSDSIDVAQELHDTWPYQEGTNEGDVIPGSFAKLQKAIDAATVVMDNPRSLQASVDNEVVVLHQSMESFRNAFLSYNLDALKLFIEMAEELLNSKVEGEKDGDQIIGSKAIFQRSIDHTKQVRNNPASTTADIEPAILGILAASDIFEQSIVVVDYSNLEAAITAAETLLNNATVGERNGDHAIGSDVIFQEAINKAQAIIDDANSISAVKPSQSQVTNAVNALGDATKAFNRATVIVDYTVLSLSISAAEAAVNNASIVEGDRNGDNIAGSKALLQNAISAAQLVKNNNQATKAQVNTAAETLKTATEAFKAATVKVDYNALKSAVSQALALYNQSSEGEKDGDKLPGSRAVFLNAINAAKAVRDNAKATQAEADNAAGALATAQSEFEAATYHVDYSGLSSAIDTADDLLNNAREGEGNGDYKAQSISALSEATGKANSVIINAGVNPPTQTRVNNSKISLLTAIASFEKSVIVVDYRALNSAIDNAQVIKNQDNYEDKYNSDKKADFESALAHAESVSDNTNAPQTEVNNAAALLIQAQTALLLTIGIDGTAIENVVVYPNPAVGYIRVGGLENASVKIFAANGALVMAIEKYNGEDIDISSLSSGSYILNANGANIQWLKK